MITLNGSVTKTVLVTRFQILMRSTAVALETIYFRKRSTANSGGTLTNPAAVPRDSNNPPATAVVSLYTAAPTPGTMVGDLSVVQVDSALVTGNAGSAEVNNGSGVNVFPPFALNIVQPIALRGVNESLSINYNGAALTAGFAAGYWLEWVEFDE
jgi:hypothetical protein